MKPNHTRRALLIITLLFGFATSLHGFTKSGSTYNTDGTMADVQAAINAASPGDTIRIPAGTFTWGTSNSSINLNKAVTLAGAGKDTIIALAANGPTWGNAVIRVNAAATVQDFVVHGTTGPVTAFAGNANNFRITRINYIGGTGAAYFCYVGAYGVIDDCDITGATGSAELIFGRGPTDSWQTPSSMGAADNVFIENNRFHGQGYVCDANSNARFVVRFNTITGPMKIDGHGLASNTPARGVRHMEVYGNTWSAAAGFWTAIEMRGGTAMVFDNVAENGGGSNIKYPFLELVEYGCLSLWPNFGREYQTPHHYPVRDQVGTGADPSSGGSSPLYLWNNRRGNENWNLQWRAIPTAAIEAYRTHLADPSATFTLQDIIKAGRDYFIGDINGTIDNGTGVGRGSKAQMLASKPPSTGVGYWVTDEGEWNSTNPGPDGQLYVWDGSSWVLKYRPYTYPHPLRGGGEAPPPPPPPSAPTPPVPPSQLKIS